jgi:hypothetical protein
VFGLRNRDRKKSTTKAQRHGEELGCEYRVVKKLVTAKNAESVCKSAEKSL